MRRHGDLWRHIVTWDNLEAAYRKARQHKSSFLNVQRFDARWEWNLYNIQDLLLTKTFRTSRYHVKYVFTPKFRQIYVLPFNPDRIVQHALMNILEPIWDKQLIGYTYSCRKGMGVRAAHERMCTLVRKNKYCLKCDISKFYPSMNHAILYDVIEHKIKCKDTLWLLHEIIHSFPGEVNVPIGNYTSQWFANLYMDRIDQWAVRDLKVDYVRYCDDFVFMSNDKEKLNVIKSELPDLLWEERRLTLSKNDLFPCTRGIDYLGYRFFPDGLILLRKRVARDIKRRMRKIHRCIGFGDNARHYQGPIASAMGLLKWCNSYNLRQSLDLASLARKAGITPTYAV